MQRAGREPLVGSWKTSSSAVLPLVVTAAQTGPTVAADRVDLVDEDDRRCVRLGLLEQVTDPTGADSAAWPCARHRVPLTIGYRTTWPIVS